MRRSIRFTSRKSRLLALSVAAVSQTLLAPFRPASVFAAPRGGHTVAGSASIVQSGNSTVITASNNSIINFTSFDIARGEKVQIIEPSARSRILERVIGNAPTFIDGALIANGQVFLVNPYGIAFGSNATLNVAGLTAVAGRYSNADFMAGNNHFTNLSGSVSNQGTIVSTGPTALIGASVINAGTIDAGNSTVVLAAGSDVFVGNHGSDIFAKVTPRADSLAAAVPGSGDIYALALGHVHAHQIVAAASGNANISGSLDASGATGGAVTVTGKNVRLTSATINASGSTGGGTVLIGGDTHGANPNVPNAQNTSVSADSTLSADALTSGNGGKVVVWSDNTTAFAGRISARGGASGGNGGFAEVSGKINLNLASLSVGQINLSAPAGHDGMLLLDPGAVDIQSGGATGSVAVGTNTGGTVTDTDINAALVTGSVTITTANGTAGTEDLTMDSNAAVSWTTANKLTLVGNNSITINGSIDSSGGTGDLELDSPATTISGTAILNIGGALTIADATGGNVTAVTTILSSGSTITAGSFLSEGSGSITISTDVTTSAAGGQDYKNPVVLGSDITLNDTFASGGGGTGITFEATVTGGGAFGLIAESDNTITFGDTVGSGASQSLTTLTSEGSSAADAGTTIINGGSVITTGSSATAQNYENAVTLGADTTLSAGTGGVTFASTVDGGFALAVTADGGIVFGDLVGGTAPLTSLSAAGSTTAATGTTAINGGGVTTTGAQTFADAVTLGADAGINSTGGGDILFASTLDSASTTPFALLLTTTGGVSFQSVGHTHALSNLDVASGGTATSLGGDVTTSAGQTYEDAVTLTASVGLDSTGGGDIAFDSTVDSVGATAFALSISSSGATTFASTVGGTNPLSTLSITGSGTASLGGDVTTSGAQTYGQAVTLTADLGLDSTGGGAISFTATLDSVGATPFALLVTTTGSASFGAVGATHALSTLTVAGGGTATNLSGDVTTTGLQSYGDAVTLSADLGLDAGSGDVTFASSLDSLSTTPFALLLTTTGGVSFQSVGHTHALSNLDVASGGTATSLGGDVTTSAGQTYEDAVTLTADVGLDSTGGGDITFDSTVDSVGATAFALSISSSGATTFASTVGGTNPLSTLSITGSGTASLGGDVTTSGAQTYGQAVTLTADLGLDSTGGGAISFTSTLDSVGATPFALLVTTTGAASFGTVGHTHPLSSLTVTPGASSINLGGDVTTTLLQTYADAVTLSANVGLDSTTGGDITFGSTVDSIGATPFSLTVTTTGAVNLDAAVGGTHAFSALTITTGGGTTTIAGDVTTTGDQIYSDAVSLTGATQSFVATAGTITFASTLTGATTAFTADGADGNVFTGNITLTSLDAKGAGGSTFSGTTVTTTAGQTYEDALTLTTSGAVAFNDNAGAITFGSTLTGATTDVTANGAGGNIFTGSVTVHSLDVKGGGTDALNGAFVSTTAGQTYEDAVTSTSAALALSDTAGAITFSSTFTGATTALTVFGVTGNTFDGTITAGSLTTNSTAGTTLNADVTTTGNQTYEDAVTLTGASRILVATAGSISFASTLTGATTALSSRGADGNLFNGNVTLLSLDTKGGHTDALNGSFVSTTAGQTYEDAVTSSSPALTLSDTTGAIVFSSSFTGATTALVSSSPIGISLGGSATALSIDFKGGPAVLKGAFVSTTGGQTYESAITSTSAALALSDTTGAITFSSTFTGATTALTVAGAGGNTFNGLLSAKSVLTSGAGGTKVLGNITTSGLQSYTDAVTLTGTANSTQTFTASAGSIIFGSTLSGPALNFVASGSGVAGAGGNSFLGAVTLHSLKTTGGTTTIGTGVNITTGGGGVTTGGGQTYTDTVSLAAGSHVLTDSLGSITFQSSVSGPSAALTVNGKTGNFFGAGIVTLKSLDAQGAAGTSVNGGTITTTGGQTYEDVLTLASATLQDDNLITLDQNISGTGSVTSGGHIDTNGQKFTSTPIQFISAFSADAQFFGPGNYQTITGGRDTGLATIIAAAVGFAAPIPAQTYVELSPNEQKELEQLGIYVKTDDAVQAELAGQSSSELIINDWPPIHHPGLEDRRVTPQRLDPNQVHKIIRDLEQIYGKNQVNKKHIADLIATSIADYRTQMKPLDEKVKPKEFARFLAAKASPAQRNNAFTLRRLADEIAALGLSPAETQGANQSWTYDLTPEDEGLVNESGQPYSDNGWLLDVLKDLPASPNPR